MKPLLPYSLIAAAALCGVALGQTTATTTPVGYTTQTLATGFNLVGLTLHPSPLASGAFETVDGNTLTDNDVTFAPVAGRSYVLEITSGPLNGYIQEVPAASISANTITTPQNLATMGLAAGVNYKLRVAPTLEEVFGTTDSILKKGATAAAADIVWVPNGSGGYDRYFLNTLNAWRNAAGGAAPNIPLVYTDGFFVERKDPAVSFVHSGEVKTGPTVSAVSTGFNLLSTVYPAGVTLQNLGLDDDLKRGATAAAADLVWVPNGTGGYNRYFLNTLNAWRNAAGGEAPANLALTSAVFIERKDPAANFGLTPPQSYSTL
jgi:hypothetical protein